MSNTGYPDFQDARDYLAGLIGEQNVAASTSVDVTGTLTPKTVAAHTRIVIRNMLVTVQALATAAGVIGYAELLLQASQGYDGAGGGAATLAVLRSRTLQGTSDQLVVNVPGPIAISGGNAGNAIQAITSQSTCDHWYTSVVIYYVTIA